MKGLTDYPRSTIQQTTFCSYFVIVNRFNHFIRKSLLYNVNSFFVFFPSKNRYNNKVIHLQVIHIYTNSAITMFTILGGKEWHIYIFQVVFLKNLSPVILNVFVIIR